MTKMFYGMIVVVITRLHTCQRSLNCIPEISQFVVCKGYHDEADQNRSRPLLTHRPHPADPPPHANAALYLCLTHFKSCWGRGAGRFLAYKSEKALEKDMFSNTGTKTAFTRGQIKRRGFRSLEREPYEGNVAATQRSCAHSTC